MTPEERRRKRAYWNNRDNAKRRDILWLFTFETWWKKWSESDKWHLRGRGRDKYQLTRPGDKGPYSYGNTNIVTSEQNAREVWKNKKRASKIRANMSIAHTGVPRSKEFCEKTSKRMIGKKYALGCKRSAKTRQKMSENNARAMLGKKHSKETRAKMSASHQRRLEEN